MPDININNVPPESITMDAPGGTAPVDNMPMGPNKGPPLSINIHNIDPSLIKTDDEYFGTPGQQVLSGLEGAAEGVVGPLAPALEEATGLTTGENIRGRAKANPFTHGIGKATGFVGALGLPGVGEYGLAAQVGNVGEHVAALLPEALSGIAATGIKTGAEMAALSTSDELSKMVTQDPGQTLGSAAVNIGLSGIIGGVGGVALGGVSSLWNTTKNLVRTSDLIQDFMKETEVLQAARGAARGSTALGSATEDALRSGADATSAESVKEVYDPFTKTYKKISVSGEAPDEGAKEFYDPFTKTSGKSAPIEAKDEDPSVFDPFTKTYAQNLKSDPVVSGDQPSDSRFDPFSKTYDEVMAMDGVPPPRARATPGVQLARWADEKGADALAEMTGKTASGVIGASLGSLIGHPIVGAWIGNKVLSPVFASLAKPFAETAIDSAAAKSAIDYLGAALRGQDLLDKSVTNVFEKGAEVISKELIPDQRSREKLQKSINKITENPQYALNVGGNLGHYLPDHATNAAATTATAVNYLNSLKPKQPITSPLDPLPPIHKSAMNSYNRALDISQQPLLPLKFVKDGTLLPQDVQTLKTIYPDFYKAMIPKITNQIINHTAKGSVIPYRQRVSLNTFLEGTSPLDTTMTPMGMQAIIQANSGQQTEAQQQVSGVTKPGHRASGATLNQLNKVNDIYATSSQARELSERKA